MKSLTSFILIVVAGALMYVYAWPQWTNIQTLSLRQVELEGAVEKAKQIETIRQQLITQYESISPENSQKINRVIPAEFDPVKLIADINDVAVRYNLVIKETQLEEESSNSNSGVVEEAGPVSPYKTIRLSFATSGQYRNFYSFVADIEKSLQLMDIQRISVASSQGQSGEAGNLDFNIILDTYWMN